MQASLTDSYKRRIDYLRISITDRCNLRCSYCAPKDGLPILAHDDILRYEEILRFARIATKIGISKVRITGGEPLVRKDALYLCKSIATLPGLTSLSITTNGVLLTEFAEQLFEAGLKRVNISLDTLIPEKYALITGKDYFHRVWKGIQMAMEVGFAPVKLNVVAMRGMNDDEIEDLARLTYSHPFHVRFIELMPFQAENRFRNFISSDEILERLSKVGTMDAVESRNTNGPAKHYRFHGANGKIGIISPVSHHFCPTCNRLRLTADGKLRTCLFATEEADIKGLFRSGASDEDVIECIHVATAKKPEKHAINTSFSRKCINRPMSAIGG